MKASQSFNAKNREVTLYKATDGTLFADKTQAGVYQVSLNQSGNNPEMLKSFLDQFKGLPKYGRLVEKSASEFSRTVGYSNLFGLCQDLALNYTDRFVAALGPQEAPVSLMP